MRSLTSLFLLSCVIALAAADNANIVVYTDSSTFGIAQTIQATIPAVSQQVGTLKFVNLTQQRDMETLNITNLSVVSFALTTPANSYAADPTNTSIVIVNSTLFSAMVNFSFINTGSVVASGFGNATITATNSTYSTFLGSRSGKPYHEVTDFNITWGVFSVQTNYTQDPTDPVNKNISDSLLANFSGAFAASLEGMAMPILTKAFNQTDQAWNNLTEYDFPLRQTFNFNTSISPATVNPSTVATINTINGSIDATGYTATVDPTTAVMGKNGKPHGIAYSLQGFKNFVQYAFDKNIYAWNFDSQTYPLNIFDYTISDLMNFAPSVGAQNPESAFVEFACVPKVALNTSFDTVNNLLNLGVQVSCGVNVIGNPTNILTVVFNSSLAIAPSIETTGTLNFNIASGSYVAGTASVTGQTLTATQTTILEYYIRGAHTLLQGSYCFIGSGIPLPAMTTPIYSFDANWFYISYN